MTDYMPSNTISDLIRTIFAWIDRVAYYLLSIMYQILFKVANADIFSNNLIHDFYGRIQLIIGLFMVFKLAVSIIQGIVNPDTFTDKKAGISSIITRIIFAVVLLTALTPFNIPNPSNRLEEEIADNGLLFGVLYDLQGRLLEQNTLGRLILGENAATTNEGQQNSLAKDADSFSVTILKTFIRINLKSGTSDEKNEDNWICKVDEDVKAAVKAYNNEKTNVHKLLSLINASCETDPNMKDEHITLLEKFKRLFSDDSYIFTYIPIVSTAVGVILIYILLGEIITIAIRTVKLAVLRLLAPIPVISYIDPKSQKDGAFGAWVKNLTSTYLELFIHLAVLYFILYLIQGIIKDGIVKNFGTGVVGAFSFVFIIIGLFFFIKQAPKFIKDVLGVKGSPGGNIGLGGMLAATGAIRQGGNFREVREAFMDSTSANIDAYNQGKAGLQLGQAYHFGRDEVAKALTGDNNMTGKKMTRGARHLRDMNISTPQANRMKAEMYDAKTEADIAKGLAERANNNGWASLTADEQSKIETAYRNYLANYNSTRPASQHKHYDRSELERDGANIYANSVVTKAGKIQGDYEDVKGMQKKYGQARSFEAKYDARRRNRATAGIRARANGIYQEYGDADENGNTRYIDIPNRQRFRSQDYPKAEASSSTTPTDSSPGGIDFTPPGATGGPVGPTGRGGPPPGH